MTLFDAQRRLLFQALTLAATQVGPEDETQSSTYYAQLELEEELLEEAARQYVKACDESNLRRERVRDMYADAKVISPWPDLPSYTDHDPGIYCDRVHPEQDHGQWMESG